MSALTTPCVNFNRYHDRDGYGKAWDAEKGHNVPAHRLAYEMEYGRTELVIDHLCRNRSCINVEHLEAVTVAENTRRGKSAKLNYKRVEIIKKMYKSGLYTQSTLGRLFGVDQGQISRVINSKGWRVLQ